MRIVYPEVYSARSNSRLQIHERQAMLSRLPHHVIAVKVGIENGVTRNHRRRIVLVEIRRTARNSKLCTRDVLGGFVCDCKLRTKEPRSQIYAVIARSGFTTTYPLVGYLNTRKSCKIRRSIIPFALCTVTVYRGALYLKWGK